MKLITEITEYFTSKIHKPFYVSVNDKEYRDILEEIKNPNWRILYLSDYCNSDDRIPDLDRLIEKLKTVDIYCAENKAILLGLGEFLALSGEEKTKAILAELANLNLGTAQVVLLLRGIEQQVKAFVNNDKRLRENDRVAFGTDQTPSNLRFIFADPKLGMYEKNGIKKILHDLEIGEDEEIAANTIIKFEKSLCPIRYISTAYEAIEEKLGFNKKKVPSECGTEVSIKDFASASF